MKLTLTTLTPVHIGSGEILSPYCDYIYEDGYVYYIDHVKISRYIYKEAKSPKLMDEFVNIINKQSANSKSKYKLKEFFEKNSLDFKIFSKFILETPDEIKSEEIKRIILTSNRPYIPGSSLKGAIRTALLYSHLSKEGYDITKMVKTPYVGGDIFGSFSNDVLKYLLVSDSNPLKSDIVKIIKTSRYNLVKGNLTIPVVREVIKKEINFEIDINTTGKQLLKNKFNYLIKGNVSQIFKMINKFSTELINKEIEILKQNNKNGKLKRIIDKYINLSNLIKEIDDKNGAILRIGAGKTFFDNTITNLFDDKDLIKVRKKSGLGDYKPFPKTRTFITTNGKIDSFLGWIEIQGR